MRLKLKFEKYYNNTDRNNICTGLISAKKQTWDHIFDFKTKKQAILFQRACSM